MRAAAIRNEEFFEKSAQFYGAAVFCDEPAVFVVGFFAAIDFQI